MTRVETLNFPSTFAVFRNHHSQLIFQIIKTTNTYVGANCYIFENKNHDNSQIWQRYQSVTITKLPFENNESIYATTINSQRRRRIQWNSSGLFLCIPAIDNISAHHTIPILGLSDYSFLPSVNPYSICFVEEFYPHSINTIVRERDDFSEIHKWLRIEQLLNTWFSYQTSDTDTTRRQHRHRRQHGRIPFHSEGPDDYDDRLSIPQEELIGAGVRYRNPYEAGDDSEYEIVTTRQSRRRSARQRSETNNAVVNAVGAGQGDTGSTTDVARPRLQKFTVDAIVEYAVNTEMSCPIKMEPITRQNAGVLSCQHVFIKDEIQRWFTTNSGCPICREQSVLC